MGDECLYINYKGLYNLCQADDLDLYSKLTTESQTLHIFDLSLVIVIYRTIFNLAMAFKLGMTVDLCTSSHFDDLGFGARSR